MLASNLVSAVEKDKAKIMEEEEKCASESTLALTLTDTEVLALAQAEIDQAVDTIWRAGYNKLYIYLISKLVPISTKEYSCMRGQAQQLTHKELTIENANSARSAEDKMAFQVSLNRYKFQKHSGDVMTRKKKVIKLLTKMSYTEVEKR